MIFQIDGLRTPRSTSQQRAKSVQFDLDPKEDSPKRRKSPDRRKRDDAREEDDRGRRSWRSHDNTRSGSPSSVSSGETIDLPPRFDELGRQKGDDPLADRLEDILNGRGTAGKLFSRLAGDLFTGSGPSRRK